MKPIVQKLNRAAIVYDADRVTDPLPSMFSEGHWAERDAVRGSAPGRGSALFLDTDMGPAVLRQYLRGGWPARYSRDRYVFVGWESTRPFREFRLLSQLCEAGLPVPGPLAAYAQRQGITYRGALLMDAIPDAVPLDTLVKEGRAGPDEFGVVGECIRRFHAAGVSHADLNLRNILIDMARRTVHLVDFDRCRYRPGTSVAGDANLVRLQRSLRKFWPANQQREMRQSWDSLIEAYRARG